MLRQIGILSILGLSSVSYAVTCPLNLKDKHIVFKDTRRLQTSEVFDVLEVKTKEDIVTAVKCANELGLKMSISNFRPE
ncbi:MAG: hypothetical protein SGJ18_13760 [Pseudomonadota bacterium]|nr:hypothetical protein [Pseudomonadota bacterium]